MAGSALDNPLVLSLLGLLLEAPRHLYGLTQDLGAHPSAAGLTVTRGSVGNLLGTLLEHGLIRVLNEEQQGRRPVRTLYTLTEAGMGELRRRVSAQLLDVTPDHQHFTQAVAYLGLFTPAEAAEALTRRREALESRREQLVQAHRRALESVPELFVIEAEFALAQLRSELDWLSRCTERIRSGRLVWPGQR